MVQNGPNDHFGQNALIPNWILAFARPKWTKMVHFGLRRSILVHLGPPTVLWPFPCPSFPWFFCFTKEKPQINQGFLSSAPRKPRKNQRKLKNNQGYSLLKINQGIQKNQGKEGQGPEFLKGSLKGSLIQARLNFFNLWALRGHRRSIPLSSP